LLELLADKPEPERLRDIVEELGNWLELNPTERNQMLPSGQQTRWHNRVAWACQYLKRAGLVETPKRGHYRITSEGRRVLSEGPVTISKNYLVNNYPTVRQWAGLADADVEESASTQILDDEATPQETLEYAHQQLRTQLADELIGQIHEITPDAFEQLVIDLLVAMGYGGNRRNAAQRIGRSGDEGIDGIINEDHLGLDVIYIQAKRWVEQSVGRKEIQAFVGALHGQRARRGVFITASSFADTARTYAEGIDPAVILIDGRQLAGYMVDFGIGVTTVNTYDVKRVDADYFNEE
jgi:restriction system protein